jgi:hypothetical protein
MEIKQEMEIVQISLYCDIIMMLMKKHERMSLTKLIVFSYLVKKENNMFQVIFKSSNKKDIVNKYLSLLSGDFEKLLNSYKYILKAIHILIRNSLIKIDDSSVISKTEKLDSCVNVYAEKDFTKKVIGKAVNMSDKQFMREVLSNV